MVPDKFDMVDMGGIDLIESQGVAVEGLYQRLVESIAHCRYQCLYNWKFNGILIPPSYVEMEARDGSVWINEGVNVDENDVVHIYSLVIEPSLTHVYINSNGDYTPPAGYDGFNFVGVSVPEPVLNTIYITENGNYSPEQGVDGFSYVSVNVEQGSGATLFNKIWSESVNFGQQDRKAGVPLLILMNEDFITSIATAWNANFANRYNSENISGAYFGVESIGDPVSLNYVDFYLGRYTTQNKELTLTVEYQAEENGEWIEIEDIAVDSTIQYPYQKFTIDISGITFHALRGRHYKQLKSSNNNLVFFGMRLR